MKRAIAPVLILLSALLLLGTAPEEATQGAYQHYAVATDHTLASRAGAEVLAAGGNAADAAAAAMLALGVVSPGSSGLGGGGFALYYDASEDAVTFLDFRERAPAAATATMFEGQAPTEGRGSLPSQYGGLATGVPGEPAGIDELIRRFGSKSRSDIAAPAIRYAEEGWEVTPYIARLSGFFGPQMKRDRLMRGWFEGDAEALRDGQRVRNPELARTLRDFARQGSAPFYRGRIAQQIVRANRARGGIMTLSDLRSYAVVERAPLEARRVGLRWVTAPPPSAGGYTMLGSLGLLERWIPPARRREAGVELMHAFAESWKGPFWDRAAYFGDPDHVDVPVAELLADERVARRATQYRPTLAIPFEWYASPIGPGDRAARQPDNSGTTHLCVVDRQGNVASVTTTVNLPFGARYSAAGMVMNDEMDDFASEVGEQNAFGLPGGAANLPAPGKRPVSTMTPTIVFEDGKPVLCVGAAGGSRIVTATQQVAWHALVRGLDPNEALAHPRVHHQGEPDTLRVETGQPLAAEIVEQLRARGHVIEEVDHSAVVQLVRIRHDGHGPRLVAVSDPRKGGRPAGE